MPIFNWIVCLISLDWMSSLYIEYMIFKYFIPRRRLPLHFVDDFCAASFILLCFLEAT